MDLRRRGQKEILGRSLTIKFAKIVVFAVFSIYLVFVGTSEYLRLRADNVAIGTKARYFAGDYVSTISSRMFLHFDELAFIGGSISLSEAATGRLNSSVESAVETFLKDNPDLGAVNVLDGSGNKIVWSTAKHPSSLKVTSNSSHFLWSSSDRMLVGRPLYSKTFRRFVVSTRYAIEVNGKPQFYVGSPVYLRDLLGAKVDRLPFQVYVTFPTLPTQQFQVVGVGKIRETKRLLPQSFLGMSLSRSIVVPSTPWKVIVSWNSGEVLSLWLRGLPLILLLYSIGFSVILFVSVALLRRAEKDRLLLSLERTKAQLDKIGMTFDGTIDAAIAEMVETFSEVELIECAMVATLNCDDTLEPVAQYGPDISKYYPETLKLGTGKKTHDAPMNDQSKTYTTTWRSLPKGLCLYHSSTNRGLVRSRVRVMLRTLELNISEKNTPYFLCIAIRRSSYLQVPCDKEMTAISVSLEQNLRLLQSSARSRYLETMYKVLSSVGEVVLGAKTLSDVLNGSTSALVKYPFFVSAGVVNFDESDTLKLLTADGRGAKEAISLIQQDPSLLEATLIRSVWRSGESAVDDFLSRNLSKRGFFELCERYDWHSSLALPIDVSGSRFGVMLIVADKPAVFHGEMLNLCRRLAQLIGRGIEEIQLKIRLDQSLERESRLARADPLTGLPNRLELDQRLEEIFHRGTGQANRFIVGVIDLDNFKPINDTFGHLCGDEVLKEFAQRLKGSLRPRDFVARLGGDEFVVVLEVDNSVESLDSLLSRLEVTYAKAFGIGPDGHFTYLQISLGVALYPEDGTDPDVLIRRADAALYQSKANKMRRSSWWERWKGEDPSLLEASSSTNDALGSVGLATLYSNVTTVLPIVERAAIDTIATIGRSIDGSDRVGHFSAYGYRSLTDLVLSYLGIVVGGVDPAMERERLERDLGNIFAYMGVSFPDVVTLIDRFEATVSHALAEMNLQVGSQRDVMESLDLILRQSFRLQFEATRSTIATCRQVINDTAVAEAGVWKGALSEWLQKLLLIPGVNSLATLSMDADGDLSVDEGLGVTSLDYQSLLKLLERSSHGVDQRNLLSDSWRNLTITTTNFEIGYLTDARAGESQVRSMAAVPIYDSAMRPVSLLVVTGTYLDMFDAPLGRQLLIAIQNHLSTFYQTLSGGGGGETINVLRTWRSALYSGGLQMYLQPIVDLKTGELMEVEGLARLVLPDGSVVAPNLFMPTFSDRELEYLLKKGTEIAMLDVAGLSNTVGDIALSINIHPKSLTQRGLAEWLKDTVRDSAIGASRLKLELLESEELLNSPQIEEALGEIRALGVKLAMDDFGSGHSNIARLREIEFNGVKIDQLVLRGVHEDPLRVLDLLGMAVMLGRDLGLEVTVEGIEDLGSMEMAAHLGAHRGQGYVIGRPMPASAFLSWHDAFVPMRRSQNIRHPLGALAAHWRYMHTNITFSGDESLCPLQLFIESKKLLASPLGEFHRAFHVAVDEQDRFAITSFSKSLMRELAKLCMDESNVNKTSDPQDSTFCSTTPIS